MPEHEEVHLGGPLDLHVLPRWSILAFIRNVVMMRVSVYGGGGGGGDGSSSSSSSSRSSSS